MQRRDISIAVACHRPTPHPRKQPGYIAICNVTSTGERPAGFDMYDDEGGFPGRNSAYCELSPLQTLYNNGTQQYMGLVHYRRVFTARPVGDATRIPGQYKAKSFDWRKLEQEHASASELLSVAARHDWVTPLPVDVRRLGYRNLYDQYAARHGSEALTAANRALADIGFGDDFERHLRHRTELRGLNMAIAHRERWSEYLGVLWEVLDRCTDELRHHPTSSKYNERWPGFLAERLLNWWVSEVATRDGRTEAHLPVLLLHDAHVTDGTLTEGRIAERAPLVRRLKLAADSSLRRVPASLIFPVARRELAGRAVNAS